MDSYNSPERVKTAEEEAKKSSGYYKLIIKILKPLFFNWLKKIKEFITWKKA